jgi:hypothetical protein
MGQGLERIPYFQIQSLVVVTKDRCLCDVIAVGNTEVDQIHTCHSALVVGVHDIQTGQTYLKSQDVRGCFF